MILNSEDLADLLCLDVFHHFLLVMWGPCLVLHSSHDVNEFWFRKSICNAFQHFRHRCCSLVDSRPLLNVGISSDRFTMLVKVLLSELIFRLGVEWSEWYSFSAWSLAFNIPVNTCDKTVLISISISIYATSPHSKKGCVVAFRSWLSLNGSPGMPCSGLDM